MRTTLPTFTSSIQRTRGGVGQYSDDRTSNRLEEMGCTVGETTIPGELRAYSKKLGKGQSFDFFAVVDVCAKCGEEHSLNIVSLCGGCAREEMQMDHDHEDAKVRSHVSRHVKNFRRALHLSFALIFVATCTVKAQEIKAPADAPIVQLSTKAPIQEPDKVTTCHLNGPDGCWSR